MVREISTKRPSFFNRKFDVTWNESCKYKQILSTCDLHSEKERVETNEQQIRTSGSHNYH
jgi:hypothetical protein